MDLPSAISELADMLVVGANALEKLSERKKREGIPDAVDILLREAKDIAGRLSAIADELRRQAVH